MDDTTDTLTRPEGLLPPPSAAFGPPALPIPGPGQISQATPMLPTPTPPVARAATPGFDSLAMYSSPIPRPAGTSPRRSGFRRAMSWLFLLAVLGGLGYAGVMFGPDLVDRARGADESNGPASPLAYPAPTVSPIAVRTATFTVSEPDPSGGIQSYEVTADFESGVAQVVIPRTDALDLEILSVWDQAFIRRIDEPVWYSLPRGEFPVDFSIGRRSRWVRTLDELLPLEIRQFTTIDEATDSFVDTLPARRLVVSADAVRLMQAQTAAVSPTTDESAPPPAPLPPEIAVPPGPDGVEGVEGVDGVEDLTMEIWIDDTGIVRKSVMPAQLGGETITVGSVSADAFEPVFPTPDEVQPLTARALFRLGL